MVFHNQFHVNPFVPEPPYFRVPSCYAQGAAEVFAVEPRTQNEKDEKKADKLYRPPGGKNKDTEEYRETGEKVFLPLYVYLRL
jgi:hypothetical protein